MRDQAFQCCIGIHEHRKKNGEGEEKENADPVVTREKRQGWIANFAKGGVYANLLAFGT